MLTASSRSTARVSASRPRAIPCTISVSAIWLPIVNTGLSAVIGSWNTSPIPAPRTFCIARSSSVSRSRPLNSTFPPAMRPGRCTSRMIENAVTDLPLPDSPTRHRVSPASTWKLTSLTAGAGPAGRSNTVVRGSTDSNESDVRGPTSDGLRTSDFGLRPSDFGPRLSDIRIPVLAEDSAHRVGNFADGGVRFDGRDDRGHQVGGTACGRRDRIDGGAPRPLVACCAHRLDALDLPRFDRWIERQRIDRVASARGRKFGVRRKIRVSVHTHHDGFARVDLLLRDIGGVLDLPLDHRRFD